MELVEFVVDFAQSLQEIQNLGYRQEELVGILVLGVIKFILSHSIQVQALARLAVRITCLGLFGLLGLTLLVFLQVLLVLLDQSVEVEVFHVQLFDAILDEVVEIDDGSADLPLGLQEGH